MIAKRVYSDGLEQERNTPEKRKERGRRNLNEDDGHNLRKRSTRQHPLEDDAETMCRRSSRQRKEVYSTYKESLINMINGALTSQVALRAIV